MPFHPLQDSESDRPRLADLGLLVIRTLAVLFFFYYQLAAQLSLASNRLWEGDEWDLVDQLAERELPMPDLAAMGLVGLLAVAQLGVFAGFFTRINALISLVIAAFALLSALHLSATLNPQALALYLSIFAGLSCGGGGRLSLDYLLAGRRARKRAL